MFKKKYVLYVVTTHTKQSMVFIFYRWEREVLKLPMRFAGFVSNSNIFKPFVPVNISTRKRKSRNLLRIRQGSE